MPDSKKYLIIHSDEGAMQRAYNKGILQSALNGCLTSVSICANGLALNEFLEEIPQKCPKLGLGVHVILTEGSAVGTHKKGSNLVNLDGRFKRQGVKGYIQYFFNGTSRRFREEVKTEIRSQIELLLKHIKLDHLSGHHHINMLPWIFDICIALAQEYKIPFVRIPREPYIRSTFKHNKVPLMRMAHYMETTFWTKWNKMKSVPDEIRFNDVFYGIPHCGFMTIPVVRDILNHHKKDGITEILFHPFLPCEETAFISEDTKNVLAETDGPGECEAITSPQIRSLINEKGFTLTNYRELSQNGGT